MTRPLQIAVEPDGTQLHDLLGQHRSRGEILAEWCASQPLLAPACGFALGVALDAWWHASVWCWGTGVILGAALLILGRRHSGFAYLGLVMAAMAAGAARNDLAMRCWPADHLIRFVSPNGLDARLRGVVWEPPQIVPAHTGSVSWLPQDPRTRMRVEAKSLEGQSGRFPVTGVVTVTIHEPALHVSAGDTVELFGRLYYPSPPRNPGEVDFAVRSHRLGTMLRMSCEKAGNVHVLASGDSVRQGLGRFRRWARQAMLHQTYLQQEAGAELLASMVIGERSAVDPELNEIFAATGTIHFLSVSGAHVGMLAGTIWMVSSLLGFSRRSMALVILVAISSYALLAEPRAPILRAALIGDCICIAAMFRRPVRHGNALALALLLLLLWRPSQLFELDTQLSFVSVASLLFLQPFLQARAKALYWWWRGGFDLLLTRGIQDSLATPSRWTRFRRWILDSAGLTLSVTLAATLGTLPLALHYFHRFSIWGPLNNLLVLPLMWFVQIVGLLKTALALVVPWWSDLLGPPLAWATDLLIRQVYLLARLPGSGASMPAMPFWLACMFALVLCLWLAAPALRIARVFVHASVGLWLLFAVCWLTPTAKGNDLRVDVLDVGHGVCCTIALPNGRHLMYDLGRMPPYDIERWIVGPHLAEQAVTGLDAVLLSHADLDHYSSLPDLARRFGVKRILAPEHFHAVEHRSYSVAKLIHRTQQMGVPWQTVRAGDRLSHTGDAAVEFLWPPADWEDTDAFNDSSLVVRLTYGGRRILLCGDIEDAAQERLLATADLRADVLLLPHHGSVRACTGRFIAAVNPQYCVRSSGRRTGSGSELAELLNGRKYFNTADDGAIQISLSREDLVVAPWRSKLN